MWSRKKNVVVAAVAAFIAVIMIMAGYAVWFSHDGPITIKDAMERLHWSVGETKDVQGTITGISRMNTTYGPIVRVQLDGFELCNRSDLLADPSHEYRVGERFRTTLHFTEYRLNNDSGVWAPELLCPIPGIFSGNGIVVDSVSYVAGFALIYGSTNQTGWTTYRVVTRNDEAIPLRVLNLTLRKAEPFGSVGGLDSAADWIVYAAAEYVRVSAAYTYNVSIVDRMDSLMGGISENKSVRFLDVGSNGYLNTGDEILVHIPPTPGDWDYQTYELIFGDCWSSLGYACGLKYIINGHKGPYEWLGDPTASPVPSILLRHVTDYVASNVTSVIEVNDTIGNPASPYSNYGFSFYTKKWSNVPTYQLNKTPTQLPDGTIVEYQDRNVNDLLDAGDRLIISGLPNRTYASLTLILGEIQTISTDWITGYGHIVGNLPEVRLTPTGQGPYRIDASVPWWHQELAIGKTLTVSLWENSSRVLDNVTMSDGMVATFPGGNLSWRDNDHNGFLSTGDYFTLNGNAAASYRIELNVLFGYRSYSAQFGP